MRKLIAVLLFAIPLFASDKTEIDRFIRTALAGVPETPGASVAVVKDGKVVLAQGYGFADLATKRPMTAKTPVYIGSSTKSYTGLLMATLASRGVVDLDTPIVKYLPELDSWPESHRVTLRLLLTHTAGIENNGIEFRTAYSGEHTQKQLIELLAQSKTIDRKFKYANLGYIVAGLVAERTTGKKWQDLLDEYVFQPLKMRDTTAYMSHAKGVAVGYLDAPDRSLVPASLVKRDAMMHAAGGIVTTANDLGRWLVANIAEPNDAFKEAHKQQIAIEPRMWFEFKRTGYGFGWYQADYAGVKMLHHFGDFPGWRAHISWLPDQKIGVAVVTNTSSAGNVSADYIAKCVYDALLGKTDLGKDTAALAADLRTQVAKRSSDMQEGLERRRKRTPTLTRALDAYAGAYANPGFGTLVIERQGDHLVARIGQLSGPIESYTQPDSGRMEIVPGSGEVLRFKFVEEGKPATQVEWGSDVFVRSGYPSSASNARITLSDDAPERRSRAGER